MKRGAQSVEGRAGRHRAALRHRAEALRRIIDDATGARAATRSPRSPTPVCTPGRATAAIVPRRGAAPHGHPDPAHLLRLFLAVFALGRARRRPRHRLPRPEHRRRHRRLRVPGHHQLGSVKASAPRLRHHPRQRRHVRRSEVRHQLGGHERGRRHPRRVPVLRAGRGRGRAGESSRRRWARRPGRSPADARRRGHGSQSGRRSPARSINGSTPCRRRPAACR